MTNTTYDQARMQVVRPRASVEDFSGVRMFLAETTQGDVLHILDAERGRACDASCLVCGDSVIAKRGQQLTPHFAHLGNAGCNGLAFESSVHLLAKALIRADPSLVVPAEGSVFWHRKEGLQDHAEINTPERYTPLVGGEILIEPEYPDLAVGAEYMRKADRALIGSRRADVGWVNGWGQFVGVEVVVCNGVSPGKWSDLEAGNLHITIQVDLRDVRPADALTPDRLKDLIKRRWCVAPFSGFCHPQSGGSVSFQLWCFYKAGCAQ